MILLNLILMKFCMRLPCRFTRNIGCGTFVFCRLELTSLIVILLFQWNILLNFTDILFSVDDFFYLAN